MSRRVVAERHGRRRADGERDVRPVAHAARAVVLVPGFVDRDLGLVRAGRNRLRRERVRAVPVGILKPRAEAVGRPVRGTAELGLEAAGHRRDDRVPVRSHPVGLVVVVELHAPAGRGQRDVPAVRLRVRAVVLVPRVVEGSLVLVRARGDRERPLPLVVARVVREVRGRAVGQPVARAAELALERARDRHGRRCRRVGRARRAHQRQREQEEDQRQNAASGHLAVLSHRRGRYERTAETAVRPWSVRTIATR